ncbi:MAG: sugar transferase [Desulfobulbus propionicus]|nr:MAG: sugar transferase [Desulfobulbus propionicus]
MLSILLLVILLPLILLVALGVRLRMGAPVLYRQTRPGYKGHPFVLIKFRSMAHATDANGVILSDSDRLSTFGKMLRASSLDELPELWNVVKGEMSLVGPRPLLMEYLPLYTKDQMRRHDVLPGLTGWAQVNGRNALSWEERFTMDLWYVDNRSFLLDLKILALTLKKVLIKDGISSEGSVTMEKFRGTGSE